MEPDNLTVVASQSEIDEAGLGRRVTSGDSYQNLHWEESKKGYVMVCDNKGCSTEIPCHWVQPK